jgi:hypothetical protein
MLNLKYIFVLIIVMFLFPPVERLNAQSNWEYKTSIYGWFAGIDGTVGVATAEQDVDATPGDLLKNLDFTMGGNFEARDSAITIIADVFYMGLSKDAQVEKTIGENTIKKSGTLDLDEWVVEGAVGYRISKQLTFLFTTRFYDINADIQFEDTTASKSKYWFDGFLGARYMTDFADNWFVSVRADVGGGGSTFAWFANGVLGYRITELFSLSLNYRILSVDYSEGLRYNYFEYNTFNHGFGVAAVLNF